MRGNYVRLSWGYADPQYSNWSERLCYTRGRDQHGVRFMLVFMPQSEAEQETMKAARAKSRKIRRDTKTEAQRGRVVSEARALVTELGWTLTADEERMLQEVENDRTPAVAA